MTLSKVLSVLAIATFILGIIAFPFMAFIMDGTYNETAEGFKAPFLLICSLLAFIALFIRGKTRGWWWIVIGILGIGGLGSAWFRFREAITESASAGVIGVTIEDILSGNTHVQIIERITFGTGFYISALGLLLLITSGIWDNAQKRKQTANDSAVAMPINEEVKTEPRIAPLTIQDEPTDRLKKLKDMLDQGLISQEDYETKKAEILSKT